MLPDYIRELVRSQDGFSELTGYYDRFATVGISSLSGSSYALTSAEVILAKRGLHIFVEQDRDTAAYLANDLYTALDPDRVMFLPTGYKRSVQYGQEDTSGIVQRTAALNAIKNLTKGEYLVVCTWPEALIEKVTPVEQLKRTTVKVTTGEKLSPAFLEETLVEYGFERVDFVHEPGQYSVRGGIIDVFSFSENRPYRLDFFGDEVESIREIGRVHV